MSKRSKAGILLMIITCASKVAALLLTLFFSRAFGANQLTDAYYAASTIPNLVNNSLTVCSLTLFIPLYTECKSKNGIQGANEFSSSVLNTYAIFNFILTIIVCLASPLLAKLVAPGFNANGHVHTRNLICLLSLSFSLTISTQVLANICNANRHHIVQAALTLMNHVITIILLITVAPHFGLYSYPFICIIAWGIHFVFQYCYGKQYFKHNIKSFLSNGYLKTMLKLSVPVIIATASEQINLAVDNIICSTLSSGSLSYLGYSHKIHTAVLGTFTAVLMTIFYPIISQDYSMQRKRSLYGNIRQYVDILLLLLIPVSALLMISSKHIINILYGNGSISEEGLAKVSLLFTIYTSSLLFAAFKELGTKLYYVIQKTKIPMIINIICVCVNICLSIIFKSIIGIYGIALATTISTLICCIIESISLIKTTGGVSAFIKKEIINIKNYVQLGIATVLSSLVSLIVIGSIQTYIDSDLVSLIIIGSTFFIIYISTLLIMKNEYCKLVLLSIRKKGERT